MSAANDESCGVATGLVEADKAQAANKEALVEIVAETPPEPSSAVSVKAKAGPAAATDAVPVPNAALIPTGNGHGIIF